MVFLVPLAWADCASQTTLTDFLAAAQRGEAAFAKMDLPGLHRSRDEGLATLPCLAELVTPTEAAAFHRMMAMAAFTTGEEARALAEFHAARRLQPGYQIPETVAPKGHPLVELYEAAIEAEEGDLQPTIPPLGGSVHVDGVRGAPRPSAISTLIQVYGPDGLQETLYLQPGDALPQWGPLPLDELQRKRRRVLFAGSTGVAAVATGILYGLALGEEARFWDTEDPVADDDLASQRARTNSLYFTSIGTGAVTLALGAVTVVTW